MMIPLLKKERKRWLSNEATQSVFKFDIASYLLVERAKSLRNGLSWLGSKPLSPYDREGRECSYSFLGRAKSYLGTD